MKKLILAGGGHGHINILKELIRKKISNLEISLITEEWRQYYSGMLPGFLEGIYTEDDFSFDIKSLCDFAGVGYIKERILCIDADTKMVATDKGVYDFDYISMNLGASSIEVFNKNQNMTYVKPISCIVALSKRLDEAIKESSGDKKAKVKLAIVGCGASGVEIALGLSARYKSLDIMMLSNSGDILENFNPTARKKVKKVLAKRGVRVHYNEKVSSVSDTLIETVESNYKHDFCIVSNGYTGLGIDFKGYEVTRENYLLVDDHLMANPYSLAMGDMICLKNHPKTAKAGVFAIRQAPFLYNNLLAMLSGKGPMESYKPQKYYLQVVSLGNKEAVLNYGKLSVNGKLAWKLKDSIDRAYMRV